MKEKIIKIASKIIADLFWAYILTSWVFNEWFSFTESDFVERIVFLFVIFHEKIMRVLMQILKSEKTN